MRASTVLAVASATLAYAQSNSNDTKVYSVEDLGPYFNEVTESEKRSWCQGQENTCRELCNRNTESNICTRETLEYECTCADGETPELQKYSQTMPTHICQFVYVRCTDAHPDDLEGKQACEDAWNANCHPDNLLSSADANDDDDDDNTTAGTTTVTSTTTSEDSESTGDSSETTTADGSDATGEGSEDEDNDDSFAAPTAVPVAGAAALAMGLVAYLV